METTLLGIVTEVRAVGYANASTLIDVNPVPKVREVRLDNALNAPGPSDDTLFGIVREVRRFAL